MKTFLTVATICLLFDGVAASAQVTMGGVPPLGLTSPLGMGPAAQVGTTGIPLGATELATPGISPGALNTLAPATVSSMTACSAGALGSSTVGTGSAISGETSATGSIAGTSAPTPLFDGAGIAGTPSGTCAGSSVASANPAASASSPGMTTGSRSVGGRVGIPLGSTELATGGLSPLPDIVTEVQPSTVSSGTGAVPCPSTIITSTPSGGC